MKKTQTPLEYLKILRPFMKEKKITFLALSKEMGYNTSHVVRVFKGGYPPTDKFMGCVITAIQSILHKDLEEFYDLRMGWEDSLKKAAPK